MRLGLLLTAVHGSDAPPDRQLAEHLELARIADRAGFDLLMAGQHFLGGDLRFYQPVPYLAHLAALHPRMRVGTGIMLLPLLHPVDVAEQIATLDVLSGGKAVWGVGLGYADAELRAFGVERRTRAARMTESLEIVKAIWSGAPVRHAGNHFDLDLEPAAVLPVQRPGPPIWVAGQVPAAVRRAARHGDAWYAPPLLSHGELRELAAVYADERAAAGRGPVDSFPLRREVFLGDSVGAALDRVRPFVARRQRTYVDLGIEKALPAGSTLARDDDDALLDRFLAGPPDEVAGRLAELRDDLGVTDFVLRVQFPGLPFEESVEQLERFADEVVPRLAPAVA